MSGGVLISPDPKLRFVDANGNALVGGKLFTYAAGTTTKQTTYVDSLGITPNANPIILDARGECNCWMLPLNYKLTLAPATDTDPPTNAIWTVDNVYGVAQSNPSLRSYLAGFTLSSLGASSTMGITAGQACDSTGQVMMRSGGPLSKTTAAWFIGDGQGGLDSGVIAPSTWYHFYAIYSSILGSTDAIFSLSPSAPTLPANYNYFRRIGSAITKTGGAPNWEGFVQDGDYFQWIVPASQGGGSTRPFDFQTTNPGTSAVTQTLAVPPGVNVLAQLKVELSNIDAVAGGCSMYVSDLATNDAAPMVVPGALAQIIGIQAAANATSLTGATILVRTNTTQQIRYRLNYSSANVVVIGAVTGWFDRRGRDS